MELFRASAQQEGTESLPVWRQSAEIVPDDVMVFVCSLGTVPGSRALGN
jgi:hypothetical protein